MMSDSPKIKHGHDTKSTWAELLESSVSALETKNLPNARIEAQWILEIASGYGREELVSNLNTEASILGAKHLNKILNRRLSGEPIQYALGSWSFRQLDLLVDSRVLIPRPETERIIDIALEHYKKINPKPSILKRTFLGFRRLIHLIISLIIDRPKLTLIFCFIFVEPGRCWKKFITISLSYSFSCRGNSFWCHINSVCSHICNMASLV